MRIVKIILATLPLLSIYLNAYCTEEQRSRMIMNNISDYEIQERCGDYSTPYSPSSEPDTNGRTVDVYGGLSPALKSGLEVRFGLVSSTGTASIFEDGYSTWVEDIDSTDSGTKLQIGYTTASTPSSSTYTYFGYQSTTYEIDGFSFFGTEATGSMVLFGSESMSGSGPLKFVYGGEFGLGSITYDDLDLGGFSAEPYIGVRFEVDKNLNINARLGFRATLVTGDSNDGYSYELYDFGGVSGLSVGYTF